MLHRRKLKLDYRDSGARSGMNALRVATPDGDGIEWYLDHSTNGYSGWVAAARVNNAGSNWSDGYLEFITAGSGGAANTGVLTLTGLGRIGIGMTNPSTKLHLASGGVFRFNRNDNSRYGELYMNDSGVNLVAASSGDTMSFTTQSAQRHIQKIHHQPLRT